MIYSFGEGLSYHEMKTMVELHEKYISSENDKKLSVDLNSKEEDSEKFKQDFVNV